MNSVGMKRRIEALALDGSESVSFHCSGCPVVMR